MSDLSISSMLVVIRSAGERTDACCKSICEEIVGADNVVVIREAPFERALARMCDVALERGATWTLSVDADLLLETEAIAETVRVAETFDSRTFHFQPPIVCNMFGGIRLAGVRLFRTEHLRRFKAAIPPIGTQARPETFTVNQVNGEGYRSVVLPGVVGIHDFQQYYRDIYRKAFVHGQKHVNKLPALLPAWKTKAEIDPSFQVALRGAYDGLTSNHGVVLNPVHYGERAAIVLTECGLGELPNLDRGDFTTAEVKRVLQSQEWPITNDAVRKAINERARSIRRATRWKISLDWRCFVPHAAESMFIRCATGLTGRH